MKLLTIFLFLSTTIVNSYGACGSQVLKDLSDSVKPLVYVQEKVLVKESELIKLELVRLGEDKLYPDVIDVKNCLAAYSLSIAFKTCEELFLKANEFSFMVRAGDITASDPNAISSGGKEVVLMDAGLTAPADVVEYYRTYPGLPAKGGYFASDESVKEAILSGSLETVGGYKDYFNALGDITEKCNTESGIPTYKDPEVIDTQEGLAVIDVFKDSTKICSFVVTVNPNKEVRFQVPSAFKSCVKRSNAMIAHIEEKDALSGELKSKKVAASSDRFLAKSLNEPVREIASVDNTEMVNSLLDGMDAGVLGSLNLAANVKPLDFNYKDISSLDSTTLDFVKYCEWGANPDNAEEDAEFIADWLTGDITEGVSADNSRGANYYWAMYFHQYQNMLFYPQLKKLHDEYKKGLIPKSDLWNWTGKGHAICWFNYPSYWISPYLFDYISDGVLNDRSTIPPWYMDSENILK